MKAALSLLSQMYGCAVMVKEFLYEAGTLDSIRLEKPVLSVGNLTVGGSGKTPMVLWLLQECAKRNLRAGVIARGYKRTGSGIQKVNPIVNGAGSIFGDEPVEIARKFSDVPVYVGTPKWRVAQEICKKEKLDLVIVDDGFQHVALERDFDVVLVDLSRPPEFYELLPLGRARESIEGLSRAECVVGTRSQIADERTAALFQKNKMVFSETHSVLDASVMTGAKLFGVVGLGNPQALRQEWESLTDYIWLDFMIFPDHHSYSMADIAKILEQFRQLNADAIAVTEKDYVKLSEFSEITPFLKIVSLDVQWREEPRRIYDFLESLVR